MNLDDLRENVQVRSAVRSGDSHALALLPEAFNQPEFMILEFAFIVLFSGVFGLTAAYKLTPS